MWQVVLPKGQLCTVGWNGPHIHSYDCSCVILPTLFVNAANPISKNEQFAIVGDLCPECKQGDLDLATNGDGRWTISWTPVQCNVANNSFIYSFQGSNPYYLKLQIANTRSAQKVHKTILCTHWLRGSFLFFAMLGCEILSICSSNMTIRDQLTFDETIHIYAPLQNTAFMHRSNVNMTDKSLASVIGSDFSWKVRCWLQIEITCQNNQCLLGRAAPRIKGLSFEKPSLYRHWHVHLCRVPVQSVSIQYNGKFVEMNRASDNYFVAFAAGGSAFQLPTQLAISSVLGDVVYDTLATSTPSVSLTINTSKHSSKTQDWSVTCKTP